MWKTVTVLHTVKIAVQFISKLYFVIMSVKRISVIANICELIVTATTVNYSELVKKQHITLILLTDLLNHNRLLFLICYTLN
jgi:hypothetical protein